MYRDLTVTSSVQAVDGGRSMPPSRDITMSPGHKIVLGGSVPPDTAPAADEQGTVTESSYDLASGVLGSRSDPMLMGEQSMLAEHGSAVHRGRSDLGSRGSTRSSLARRILDEGTKDVESPAPPPPSPEPKELSERSLNRNKRETKSRESVSMEPLKEQSESEGSVSPQKGVDKKSSSESKSITGQTYSIDPVIKEEVTPSPQSANLNQAEDPVAKVMVSHVAPRPSGSREKLQQTFMNVDIPAEDVSSLQAEQGSSGPSDFTSSSDASPTLNCSGRKVLNGDEGYISDGPEDYLANSHCEWLIDAGNPNKTIHLHFQAMSTECSFDFIFIYDGNSYASPLLATLSGDSMPHPLTARSGYMLLYMYSDRNYLKHGFEARYHVFDCPWNCSGHGVCSNHTCRCSPGYYGDGCQYQFCVDNCGANGTCIPISRTMKKCQCDEGYIGHACNISTEDGRGAGEWFTLQPSGSGFKGRTSHTAVFLEGFDCLWVFGGFDLNTVLGDLSRYCFHTNVWEVVAPAEPWPDARSGHAAAAFADGFYMFGGVLANGSHSNELWFYNATSSQWRLTATSSSIQPNPVTGHTLTAVDDWLYLIGGKTEDRVSRDDVYRINATKADSWEVVVIKGSRYPPKRLVSHTTVYHKESYSLIVFGGYLQSSALFSDRTQQVLSLSLYDNYWSELHNSNWQDKTIPKQRAFHSAVTMGNYMVVYGGNTHDHSGRDEDSGLEICYNPRMYFYHLGCHVWLNHTYFTGLNAITKGRFGHVAAVAHGNLMLIVGGYSGQVLDDLIVYKVPSAISPSQAQAVNDTDHCEDYAARKLCLDDPECVYCEKGRMDSGLRGSGCVHRSRSDLCVESDIQDMADRCPGICPTLHTCGACVSHGQGAVLSSTSPRRRVHIKECSWCVKEAQCQTRSMPAGTCRAADQTRSGIQGWWGGLSSNLTTLLQCQHEDFPAGLHWIKYRNPMNSTFPDELTIQRTTSGTLGYVPTRSKIESEFNETGRFVGFLHPLNAPPPHGEKLKLFLGLSSAKARLYLSVDGTEEKKEKVISVGKQSTFNVTPASRMDGKDLFPNVSRDYKYYISQVTEQVQRQAFPGQDTDPLRSDVSITWNGCLSPVSKLKQQVITSEFLEPFSHGDCSKHYNCLDCLTDTLCSWCQVTHQCVSRNDTEAVCRKMRDDGNGSSGGVVEDEEFFITSPSECPSCELNHVQCHTCADCVWCENTQTCLPFADYVTRYIFGQCTSWVDTITQRIGCHSCAEHTDCQSCLANFGCGWCGNDDNPTLGVCVDGDFTGPSKELTCSAVVAESFNISSNESASWSYDRCPDVEECRLGLHDCHPNATCRNTPQSYECRCNQGFVGDGKDFCEKTCYHSCVHGFCSRAPDYVCECHLGWTNASCDVNCECNNHSTCSKGVGICDECQHRTTGEHCEKCSPGSYGQPKDLEGCRPCDCNGHGDRLRGECHGLTGECFCTHNTQGLHCDICLPGYYGNPRNGGKCYLRCDDRTIMTNISTGGLGSYRGTGVDNSAHAHCLWILTVFPKVDDNYHAGFVTQIISFTVEGTMEVECGRDTVYVYDGIPAFIYGSKESSARPLGSICGINPGRDITVHAYSGTITVYFEGDLRISQTKGFNATYKKEVCRGNCRLGRDRVHQCYDGKCICPPGFYGPDCSREMCPRNCYAQKGQGWCDLVRGMCRCQPGYGGVACNKSISANQPHIELLMDDQRLQQSSMHIHAPVGRVGHTMVSCGNKKLYVFGGYHLKEGLLNDVWRFDTASGNWTRLDPPTQLWPGGRYHHAAACVPMRKEIYIYGGFVHGPDDDKPQPSSELWKFNIESYVWTLEKTPPWVPALVGHTLTYVGDGKLVLIGGFSSQIYFSNRVFEYDTNGGLISWREYPPDKMTGAIPIGLYGHSAIYNEASDTIYVYGGYLFSADRWSISQELYTYGVHDHEWNRLYPAEHSEWEGRVFHTAVGTEEEMIVIGGRNTDGSYAMNLLAYRYHCNTWHRLQFAEFEVEQQTTAVSGVRAVLDGSHIYMFGGFEGTTLSTLSRLTLPDDICATITDPFLCTNIIGCLVCNTTTALKCYSADKPKPENCGSQGSVADKQCNVMWHQRRPCYRYTTCSQCLSTYPQFKSANLQPDCPLKEHNITKVQDCFEFLCPASDCQMCGQLTKQCEIGRFYNKVPIYNWTCVTRQLRPITAPQFEGYPPGTCPARCYTHTNCKDCLMSHGIEGGSQMCMWSESLQECMPPAYLPLRCSFGECGYVRSGGNADTCPESCHQKKQCAHCITSPGCGWCAYGGMNGYGVCMSGGFKGPTRGSCSQGNVKGDTAYVAVNFEEERETYLAMRPEWAFDHCPTENECDNGHHTCDRQTQDCIDTLDTFTCQCKKGYVSDNARGKCGPVCHQGCINGVCVQPDYCQCHFGWVGNNCSVECQCNKHSNCKSITETTVCTRCENNTMGEQCSLCKENFAGNPLTGDPCDPCSDFCYGHTDTCTSQDISEMSLLAKMKPVHGHGPTKRDAICKDCQNNTQGTRCEECTDGHFRRSGAPKTEACIPCQCNGHSNQCNKDTGENCACQNNTETNCEAKEGLECWQMQCAQCKEYFLGLPTNGHQCYRQMQVDLEYCLDPSSQTECIHNPGALLPGRTVFYAVQPKYLNVDIRITIDITQGGADVFFSNQQDMFQVLVDKKTGIHTVKVDEKYKVSIDSKLPIDVHERQRRSSSSIGADLDKDIHYVYDHIRASSLNTYITISEKNTILVVRNVQFRMVITLPEKDHDLRSSRFYIIVQSNKDAELPDHTFGILYFRQDQPHIDLFVFFSVFFSCFFLFLALCVMLWKMKQAFDARRSRQLREREMECMASRPFAKVLVLIEGEDGSDEDTGFGVRMGMGFDGFGLTNGSLLMPMIHHRRGRLTRPMLRTHHPMELSPPHVPPTLRNHPLGVVPIAVEPTDDGVAAVGTFGG
nr:hypothetical protein BaRGS_013157 [Batillaria attramentaria]